MRYIWVFLVFSFPFTLWGQVHSSIEHPHQKTFPHFRAVAVISHTLIPAEHTSENLWIPSWGLDIEYWFSKHLGVGFHNDIELESFLIERPNEEILERKYPLVTTLDALIKPGEHLVAVIGPGFEFAQQDHFFLFRFGLEYEIEIGHHWDLAPTVFYDTRTDNYQTWSVGVGIGKRW